MAKYPSNKTIWLKITKIIFTYKNQQFENKTLKKMNNSKDLYGNEYDSEDDEGFFLTPVLHYDISNKIKEANKILFDENAQEMSNGNKEEEDNEEANKRVTFSNELVSYAPNVILDPLITTTTTTTTANDDEDEISIKEELETPTTTKITIIDKLTELNDIIDEIDNQMILEQVNTTTTTTTIIQQDNKKSDLLLDSPLITNKRHISNEDALQKETAEQIIEQEDEEAQIEAIIDEDENSTNDDSLSMQVGIIARTQIPQEMKEQKMKPKDTQMQTPQVKKSNTGSNQKRGQRGEKNKVSTPKFNYKTCCEYQQSRLPQYKGHVSEYGLSLREREHLLQLHKRQERNLLEHETRIHNETMHRLTANEKAFSAWLINKCRNAPNRTQNMFDSAKLTKIRKTTTKQLHLKQFMGIQV